MAGMNGGLVASLAHGCWFVGHAWRQHEDGIHWVCAECGAVR